MELPQVVVISVLALNLGVELAKHGQPKEAKHNFGVGLLSVTIWCLLLWWGGFWQ